MKNYPQLRARLKSSIKKKRDCSRWNVRKITPNFKQDKILVIANSKRRPIRTNKPQ